MLVSIVLNNFNYQHFLVDAVESALAQDHEECEVIVVDDGSTDKSRAVLESYSDRVELILKENGGQASAFNVGIQAARGEFIILLDADDVLEANAVSIAVGEIDDEAVRLSYRLMQINSDGGCEGLFHFGGPDRFLGSLEEALRIHHFFPSTPTSGNFFRASALKAILPIPQERFRICADSYIFVQISYHGPIQLIPDQLGQYRIHGNNNYISTSGRRSLTDAQLLARLNGNFAVWDLLAAYGRRFCPDAPNVLVRIVRKRESLRLISEAKRRHLSCELLHEWTLCRLIREVLGCLRNVRSTRGLFSWGWSLFEIVKNARG